ncbi:MAG: endopeptidase La [Anaerolineae bacterium]
MSNQSGVNEFQNVINAEPDSDGYISCAVIPLRNIVIFPHVISPVNSRNPRVLAAIQSAISGHKTVIGIAQRDPSKLDVQPEDLFTVGTEMALSQNISSTDIKRNILAQGRRRVEIIDYVQRSPFFIARARVIESKRKPNRAIRESVREVIQLVQRLAELKPSLPEEVVNYILDTSEPELLADFVSSALMLPLAIRQQLLELTDAGQRLVNIAELLEKEIEVLELRDEINTQVQQEIDRSQREMYLREQMRIIQGELGETDIFQQEVNEVRDAIVGAHLPTEINEKALKELSRLMMMPPMAPEVGIIRTYIDWLTGIPWSVQSEDNLDITHAKTVLDEDHYGLPKVKDRILEYIAVRKLASNKMKSPILCFVGPPGVGKTSLGKSIARALGREFIRVSLGGVRDEAEIRGHRRTYIGALPGRILQTMRRAGTINPVFMLDEIDKLGMDFRGDPASALLEVLDPEQNNSFSDHYLEVPYDLSKVLFITTANDLDPIPLALIDRMEIIEFSGYTDEEKSAIAREFLIPNQIEAHGLQDLKLKFDNEALRTLVREYTYEGGVRNFNREIANICRKVARLVAENKPYSLKINRQRVIELLGPPIYTNRLAHNENTIGLVTGLVWTYDGGDISMIEVSILPGKGTLLLTGQLGEVMQESAQTALSYMRSRARDYDIPSDDFENYDVHIHLPEGAIPKEGPSAGITLATAIISAFTERKIRSNYAMTGEITLHGKVLAVGGVKEKVLAAQRAGIRNVILPAENKKDLIDIPKDVQHKIKISFVSDMQQVIEKVLLAPPASGRKRDKERQEEEKAGESTETAAQT